MRKVLIILIIVLVLVLVGIGGWYLLSRNSGSPIAESIRDILPFGSGEDINIPALNTPEEQEEAVAALEEQNLATAKLFRIVDTPIAGFVSFNRGGSVVVRYVDRATGHISEVILPNATSSNSLTRTKILNQTLPKLYEAYFISDGSFVFLLSLKDDSDVVDNRSLVLTAPRSTSTDGLYSASLTNLRGDIDSVLVGSGNSLSYVLRDAGTIVSSTFTGTGLKTLFTSAFNNWRISRLGNNLLLSAKAHAGTPGYTYSLPSGGGSLTKLLGPLNGLVAVGNSSGNSVLYSYVEGGETKLFTKNIQANTTSEILPATLAEKCVWSTKESSVFFCGTPLNGLSGKEPNEWYLGKSHFSDYLWRFDTDTEIAQLIAEPKTDFNVDLDISEPKLSPDEDYLIFINKRDLTLWAIRL